MKIAITLTSQALRMYRVGNVEQARIVWNNAIAISLNEKERTIH